MSQLYLLILYEPLPLFSIKLHSKASKQNDWKNAKNKQTNQPQIPPKTNVVVDLLVHNSTKKIKLIPHNSLSKHQVIFNEVGIIRPSVS